MFENKKIFILGMARSGYEACKLLLQHGNEVLITDAKDQDPEKVKELENMGADFVVTNTPDELLDESFDYMVKNPGIIRTHPCVQKAHKLNIPVINEVEMAYHFLPENVKIIAITGSNGKTTTTTIIYKMLEAMNKRVHLGGNIGYPLSGLINKVKDHDILVMEISDHQLCDMYKFHPETAVLTNLSEVHIDFHGSYKKYKETKKKLFMNMDMSDLCIINQDNKDAYNLTKDLKIKKEYFSSTTDSDCCIKNDAIYYHNKEVIKLDDIRIKGMHNYENIMAAIMVCKKYGVTNEVIHELLENFDGVEHRIEFVRRLDGREFYNDSKSTNNKSTITALLSFKNPIVLILGGLDRGQSFDELTPYMKNVKHVICYGQTKEKINEYCKKINKDCIVLDNLEDSTKAAYNLSEKGDVILFSPACASWDQFDNFEIRGDLFKRVVEELKDND